MTAFQGNVPAFPRTSTPNIGTTAADLRLPVAVKTMRTPGLLADPFFAAVGSVI